MIPSTEEFRLVFKSARTVGTPLVAIQTADPASAMTHVTASVNAKKGQTAPDRMGFSWQTSGTQ